MRVAPARERGLKFVGEGHFGYSNSRSREGAWIEMLRLLKPPASATSLPRGSVD